MAYGPFDPTQDIWNTGGYAPQYETGAYDYQNDMGPAPPTGQLFGMNTPSQTTPSGIPDPSNPGYDTHGFILGATQQNGQVTIPNANTGQTSTYDVANPLPTLNFEQTQPSGTFGGPVAPYSGGAPPEFNIPALPDALKNPYRVPTWEELQATPGYMARYQMGLDARQRAAAARGTLLNGGTLKALTRYGQDYATNAYNDLVNQGLQTRQQQANDYLNLTYGPEWQKNQAATNRYGQLYGQYQDLISNNRNASNDYYSQQLELAKLGLQAAGAGNPGTGSA